VATVSKPSGSRRWFRDRPATGLLNRRIPRYGASMSSGRKRVLAIVLAGGEGKRLMPLTADRAKPAVPFAGIYRLIDFALSNVVNSGYLRVVVLTQYKSHSLDRHVTSTWRMSTLLGNYIAPVPAQQRLGKHWYLGSGDAIYQSLNLIHDDQPDIVVVVGADHVYRMDFAQMVDQHVESGAACSVAAIRQPISLADQFGVIDVSGDDPRTIRAFLEKPKAPQGLPDSPDEVLASMGNYVFDAAALVEAVTRDSDMVGSKHDMGGDIVPAFVRRQEAGVYDFKDNQVPGATDRDRGYWRDVGTMRSYYDAHVDVVSPLPVFNLYNGHWPIYTAYGPLPPVKLAKGADGTAPVAEESLLSPGVVVTGGQVRRSVLSPAVRVEQGALVEDSVLMNSVLVGEGAVVRNAILDKAIRVPPGAEVGIDPELDRKRGFLVVDGLTVLGKGQPFPDD
jgi:glucose-1-phosphate adenylyltransferase